MQTTQVVHFNPSISLNLILSILLGHDVMPTTRILAAAAISCETLEDKHRFPICVRVVSCIPFEFESLKSIAFKHYS